jgi:glutamine synthetase
MTIADPQSLNEALADKERVKEAKAKLVEAGVKYVYSCWIDLLGIPKTKPVPIEDFELLCAGKGPQFAVHSVSFVPELGASDSDQIPVPDLDTLVICPWDRKSAWMFADLWWEDKPYYNCPRSILKRIVRENAKAGYACYAGVEPEFIVMKWENGQPVKAFDDDPRETGALRPRRQAFGYDIEYSINSMGFLGDCIDVLQQLGWGMHDVVCEGAYSQFELDFHYTNVLEMADRFAFLRVLVKEIAKKHGLFVTFMPKPTTGDWRSGAHMNTSLQPADKKGTNVFGNSESGWANEVYQAVGGILKHGAAITAVACSTVNSYNGLVPRVGGFEGGTVTWAPTHMTYGNNNRSAMLRLPQTRYCIENRAADMCMNPYLSLGLTAAAMVDGVVNKIDPGKPFNRDLYSMTDDEINKAGITRLPRNLLEACEALKKSDFARKTLGDKIIHSYLRYKLDEWERYHQTVTDWEVREYLRLY